MTVEFTGERVVPGQVDDDLWNEHFARYAFAARYAAGKRVLDCGCGTGYGSAELARVAQSVTSFDVAWEAVSYAQRYSRSLAQASCTALPFRSGSFDLVVCFEVIEHLVDWAALLDEVKRVLTQGGQFIVSTPNKLFYADSRKQSGPNPYHEHEFEYEEFRDALAQRFAPVSLLAEDHVESIVFRNDAAAAQARLVPSDEPVSEAAYFVAVCGTDPEPFVFVPRAANALREKVRHIERLEQEIATKDRWIAEEQAAHQQLLKEHAALQAALEKSNRWAQDAGRQLTKAGERIVALQDEYAAFQRETTQAMAAFEAQTAEFQAFAKHATETEARLTAEMQAIAADRDRQIEDLNRCIELLHTAEALVEERTRWAQSLDARITAATASRWIRLGRTLGLGPELEPR